MPGIVHGPGWLGLAEARTHEPWHHGLTGAGYAVLAFNYRGFGDSDGERGWVRPEWQLEDILNAITFLETRPDVNAHRIGTYGIGGTGGGNAIMAAAVDSRVRCVAAQLVVADGTDWLHRMRREYEWVEFVERVAADRRRWVLEATGDKVDPRAEPADDSLALTRATRPLPEGEADYSGYSSSRVGLRSRSIVA